jgi:hypothetical protein
MCGLLCVLAHCSVRAEDEPSETPPKKPTVHQMLSARPAPDLETLAERSVPALRGPDATESFWDVLKVRETADPNAVAVLEKILVENRHTGRIHGFAAAQALICIGTPEAHEILARHVLNGISRAGTAFDYTAHWDMPEPQRSRFIGQYLLKNTSTTNLLLKLEQKDRPDNARGGFDLLLTFRNTSKETLHFTDPHSDMRSLVYLRDARGRYLRHDLGKERCPGPSTYIDLDPGQVHRYLLHGTVAEPSGRESQRSTGLEVEVIESCDFFAIDSPGRFDVLAMFEAEPLTEQAREYLKVDEKWNWWTGRAVSKPITVNIASPAPESPRAKQ